MFGGFQQQADPLEGFAKNQGGELAFEDAAAKRLAIDDRGKDAGQKVGFGIEAAKNFQLVEGFGPVAEN